MGELEELTSLLKSFRDARNWEQFHNPKDLATALSIEAAELNELYLWKRDESEWEDIPEERIREELADIFAYALLLADRYDLDISEIVREKVEKNEKKYPVEKSYNRSTKYSDLPDID